jgi:hypothetical protein
LEKMHVSLRSADTLLAAGRRHGGNWVVVFRRDRGSQELRHGLQTAWKQTKSVAEPKQRRLEISRSTSGTRSDHRRWSILEAEQMDLRGVHVIY